MLQNSSSLDSNRSRLFFVCTMVIAALMVFSPLLYGGSRPLPQMVIELAALALLALSLLCTSVTYSLPRSLLFLAFATLVLPLLQLIPVPDSLWVALSGRAFYADALARALPGQTIEEFRQISLNSAATELGFYALLPALALVLVMGKLPTRYVLFCVYAFLFIAFVQASLALVQSATGVPGSGTYPNRNHLAGMLVMALPLALGLISSRIGKSPTQAGRSRSSGGLKGIVARISNVPNMNAVMLLAMCSVLISLGIIFSRSRTGIAMMMLGLFLSAVLFGRLMGEKKSIQVSGLIVIVVATLAIEIGLAPVVSRFGLDSAADDARWSIFAHAYEGLKNFFPLGSGIGSFPEVFRRFQPESVSGFVNHAHNGYLEYVFEGGIFALGIIIVFAVVYLVRWAVLLRMERGDALYYVQIGAGVSVLLLGLHEIFDFNMHIPANNLYFAFVVAIFFYQPKVETQPKVKRIKPSEIDTPRLQLSVLESKSNPFS